MTLSAAKHRDTTRYGDPGMGEKSSFSEGFCEEGSACPKSSEQNFGGAAVSLSVIDAQTHRRPDLCFVVSSFLRSFAHAAHAAMPRPPRLCF